MNQYLRYLLDLVVKLVPSFCHVGRVVGSLRGVDYFPDSSVIQPTGDTSCSSVKPATKVPPRVPVKDLCILPTLLTIDAILVPFEPTDILLLSVSIDT